jgi:NAD(P)-dependent dehydrogenase (short-subunit alcohol dehydrogenase family)
MLCNLVARRLVNTTPVLAAAMAHWNLAEVASLALFLASDESSYMTGTAAVVYGGVLSYI